LIAKPVFQVYDDNDDYSEEEETEADKNTSRLKFGFDILSLLVPVRHIIFLL